MPSSIQGAYRSFICWEIDCAVDYIRTTHACAHNVYYFCVHVTSPYVVVIAVDSLDGNIPLCIGKRRTKIFQFKD